MISCTFENGHATSNLRHVCVEAIVINEKNQLLLVKRAAHLLNGGKYGIPGGFVDRDETTEQAVLRELKEETGYNGEVQFLFQIVDNPDRPKEDRQNISFRYVVDVISGEMKDNSEVSEIKWFDLDSLPPEEEHAFDHFESVQLYVDFKKKPFPLPVLHWKK
jgi:8-oxo-dGTP diphosphatase